MKKLLKLIVPVALLFLPVFALAATSCPSSLSEIANLFPGTQYCSATEVALAAIRILMSIIGIVAALFIVWGGFQYITSAGNAEKAESARRTLTNSAIGLALALLAWVIVGIVINTISKSGVPTTSASGSVSSNNSGNNPSGSNQNQSCTIGQISVSLNPSTINYGDSFSLRAYSQQADSLSSSCGQLGYSVLVHNNRTGKEASLGGTGISNGVAASISTSENSIFAPIPSESSMSYFVIVKYTVSGSSAGLGSSTLTINYQ